MKLVLPVICLLLSLSVVSFARTVDDALMGFLPLDPLLPFFAESPPVPDAANDTLPCPGYSYTDGRCLPYLYIVGTIKSGSTGASGRIDRSLPHR